MKMLIILVLGLLASESFAASKLVGQVNINEATQASLVLLPGVGPKRAKAIITLRQKRPFRRAVQLRRIRGIGRRTLMKMLPFVRLQGPTNLRRVSP
jgi:competence protein ComEA